MLQRESLFQSPKGVNDLQVLKEEQPIQLKDLFGTSWHVPSVLGVGQQEVAERLAAGHTLGDLHLPQDGGDVGVGHHTSPSLTSSSASVRDRSQAYGWVWGYGRDSESNEK